MTDKTVRVRLTAVVGDYQTKLAAAANSTRKFATDANTNLNKAGQQFEKLGISANTMKLGVAAAAVVAGRAIWDFSKQATEAQSALNEQLEATSAIFDSGAGSIRRFAQSAVEDLHMSERAALEAANGFAVMFDNIGLSDKARASMTENLVALSADLASQRDMSIDDVNRRLQSGMAGEAEAVRRLGADLTEANVKAEAARMGLGGLGRELTHGEKVLARYQILLRSTSSAHGDLARTANSLANQQRKLAAQQEEFKANQGSLTAPAKTGVMVGLNEDLAWLNNLDNLSKRLTAAGRQGADQAHRGAYWQGLIKGWNESGKAAEEAADTNMSVIDRLKAAGGRGAAQAYRGNYWGGLIRGWNESGKAAEEATGPTSKFAEAVGRYQQALVDGKGDSAEAAAALADVKRFAAGAASEQDALAEATMTSAEKFELQRQAVQLVHDRMMAVPIAQRAMQSSTLDLADSHDAVADKQRELNELMRRGPIDTEALASARDRLASATEGVGDAEERLADARQRVADLERQAPMRAEELAVAREKARQEIGAAERRLSTVKAAGGSPTAIAEAEVALREARLELTQVDERAIDQERDLSDAREGAIDAAKDLTKEREEERRASEEVTKASQADVEWTREVEKKKRELERAVIAVRDAEDGMVTVAWNLREALDQQNTPLNTNVQLLGQLRAHYERMVELYPSLAPLLGLPNITPQEKLMLDGARANGGPVWPGSWLVGEDGPEVLRLGAGGRGHVTPAPQTAQMIRQSNTTSDASMFAGANVTIQAGGDPDAWLRSVSRRRRLANLAAV